MNAEPLETLLAKIRTGDFQAADQVFLAYEPQLRLIVRRQLSSHLRAKFDSLDVVQSAWARVLHDFRARGCRVADSDHLRNLLIQVTRNCLTDRLRHFRKALEVEKTDVDVANAVAARQPRPSEVAQGNELWDNMLASCPRKYHELLRLKRQGLPLEAIARETGFHEGSVRRIIRQLARKLAFPSGEKHGHA